MFAATLTIENLSTDQGMLNETGWSRPVEMNVSTHVKDEDGEWKKNPEYIDSFETVVTCDDSCSCSAVYVPSEKESAVTNRSIMSSSLSKDNSEAL